MKRIVLAALIGSLGLTSVAYAHPGRTDANGGHYCRTNCQKWGLSYGQYVMHSPPKAKPAAKTQAKKTSKTKAK